MEKENEENVEKGKKGQISHTLSNLTSKFKISLRARKKSNAEMFEPVEIEKENKEGKGKVETAEEVVPDEQGVQVAQKSPEKRTPTAARRPIDLKDKLPPPPPPPVPPADLPEEKKEQMKVLKRKLTNSLMYQLQEHTAELPKGESYF
jgi:hypothetical protein